MNLITLDFETFYGDGYTLSSMTTEEYVRDPRFEAILCSFKVNKQPSYWVPRDGIAAELKRLELHKHAVLHHHAHFDALILNHHYGVRPKLIMDTLGMARALHGANGKLSLEKLGERYGIGVKGKEVLNARNMRYKDFHVGSPGMTPEQVQIHATVSRSALAKYGEYSCNDSDMTFALAQIMAPQFSRTELEVIDYVVRMFTEPVLELDADMLTRYAEHLRAEKLAVMMKAGVQLDDLMSNAKFAVVLQEMGVDPPMKISPTTGKLTYAFAKTDPGMQALQEHPDEMVQALVEARLKNKTTLAEKRAQRMIGMASRGKACVYLKYSGASGTHRLSGGDKMNWQNFTREDPKNKETTGLLRKSVMAPLGSQVVVGDSSNIEARILDWLAGQTDMVQVYIAADNKVGPDMYCIMAERIYKRPINKKDHPQERQMGKIAKLGLGFGLGHERFVLGVRASAKDENGKPLVITLEFAKKVVDIYRDAHPQVKKLWKRGEDALKYISNGVVGAPVDYQGVVKTCKDGLVMPGGLRILFPDLKYEKNGEGNFGGEWTFWNGKAREHIYGAKLIENIVQCLARIIVFEQCRLTAIEVNSVAKWVHSVHDEGVFVAEDFYAPYVLDRLLTNMRIPPAWCLSLPLNSEGGFNRRYGNAK